MSMTDKEKVEILQAYMDGESVQVRNKRKPDDKFTDDLLPVWNFDDCEYRIKPDDTEFYLYGDSLKSLSVSLIGSGEPKGWKYVMLVTVVDKDLGKI